MSFKMLNFSSIRIFVNNLKDSRDWYKSFFNFDPIEDLEDFVSFDLNGTRLELVKADTKNPFSTGGCVGYWLVDNLEELISKIKLHNAKIFRGPLRVDEIQKTILQIQDPYGNVLGFEIPF